MVDKHKIGTKQYRPSQAAPQGDQPLRHYLNRELQNISASINGCCEPIEDIKANCYCMKICDEPVEGGCLQWTVVENTVTIETFWTPPANGGETGTVWVDRTERDNRIIVSNDEIYIQDREFIYHTTNYGTAWTPTLLLDWMPIDANWSNGEKTDPGWTGGAWPNNYPRSDFTLQNWSFIDGEVIACFGTPSSTNGYITNVSTGDILVSGWGYNAWSEDNTVNYETFLGQAFTPVAELHAFTVFHGIITALGESQEKWDGDPYPSRMSIQQGATDPLNCTTLYDGSGAIFNAHTINGNILYYGSLGGEDGGGVAWRYGYVDSTIQSGLPYMSTATWAGNGQWRPDNAATLQPSLSYWRSSGDPTEIYPETFKHREAKWLTDEKSIAGPVAKRYATLYSNLDDGILWDYAVDYYYPNQNVYEVIPVASKGAFITIECYGTDITQVAFRISATGEPGSYSEAVTGVLPVGYHNTIRAMTIDYSAKNAAFLMTYMDTTGYTRVVTFADPFVCALYEEV